MINSILFLLALVVVLFVLRWYMLNEKDQSDGTKGFLGMKKED